jgi:hypothetical protein
VGEAIHMAVESNSWLMNAASGTSWWMTRVYGPVASIAPLTGGDVGFSGSVLATCHGGAMPALTPAGPRSRFQFHSTACALNGVPSLNVTPWRSVIVTVLASGLKR